MADARAVARQVDADLALAERARREGLPGDVRVLGSTLRDFHTLEARGAGENDMQHARRGVDTALRAALAAAPQPDEDGLVALRAVQLESFIAETRAFEQSGVESDELHAVGGAFVERMRQGGWCKGHALVPDELVRRVMFKQMWVSFLSLDDRADLAPTLDELRVLYAFYLSHPHASEATRAAFEDARRSAPDKKACDALDVGERLAVEQWRLERVAKLAAIDPAYPASYARGVVQYRRGNYGAAADAFRDWLRDHPGGPWSLRARNHLMAAIDADRSAL
jgi:hypothetical protein